MTAILLNGKELAERIIGNFKKEMALLKKKPVLAVILIGNDPASEIYINKKEKTCLEVGIASEKYYLDINSTELEIIALIERLNSDEKVNGILIQLPLPKHLDEYKILETINPNKDVDGLTSHNLGKLAKASLKQYIKPDFFIPCTPKGILRLLQEYQIDIEGKNVVIVNHSNILGKPLSLIFLNLNSTITVCHKFTKDLKRHTSEADILITGVGKPKLITNEMVKKDAVIIDVGISKLNEKIFGDVDFEAVKEKVAYITPVPGGIGPMTIAMLMENTLDAYYLQNNKLQI